MSSRDFGPRSPQASVEVPVSPSQGSAQRVFWTPHSPLFSTLLTQSLFLFGEYTVLWPPPSRKPSRPPPSHPSFLRRPVDAVYRSRAYPRAREEAHRFFFSPRLLHCLPGLLAPGPSAFCPLFPRPIFLSAAGFATLGPRPAPCWHSPLHMPASARASLLSGFPFV